MKLGRGEGGREEREAYPSTFTKRAAGGRREEGGGRRDKKPIILLEFLII